MTTLFLLLAAFSAIPFATLNKKHINYNFAKENISSSNISDATGKGNCSRENTGKTLENDSANWVEQNVSTEKTNDLFEHNKKVTDKKDAVAGIKAFNKELPTLKGSGIIHETEENKIILEGWKKNVTAKNDIGSFGISHIYFHSDRHVSGSAEPQISKKMTAPDGLKPAPIKKSPLAKDKFNQFVEGRGTGIDNPRPTTDLSELNAGSGDTILKAVEASEAVLKRVRKWKSNISTLPTAADQSKLTSSLFLQTENPLWLLRRSNTTNFPETQLTHPNIRPKTVSFGVMKYQGIIKKHPLKDLIELTTMKPTVDTENSTGLGVKVEFPWPVKKEAVVEGDLILGGLMMVHEREDTITCGPVMPQGGIQALEAMLYTLDRLNDSPLLPNITLGAHILDDCDKDTYGLEMAVDFIKALCQQIRCAAHMADFQYVTQSL